MEATTGSEWIGPKHHRRTAMEHFAGIDVSLEQSSVCVVDAAGKIIREAKVASEPEDLVRFFRELGVRVVRIVLEARHVKAALSAMVVKTDRKDARASRSCCAWVGSGRCTPSRRRRRRSEL